MKSQHKGILTMSPQNRLWAIWIWNRDLTESTILLQLAEFIEKGFAGVAVRPGRDMRPAFLSEEFYALFEKVLVAAKAADFGVKLADDLSIGWTGTFQREAETTPAIRAQRLILEHEQALANKEAFEYPVSVPDQYIAMALRVADGKMDVGTVKHIPITSKCHSISWKAPAGEWHILVLRKIWHKDVLGNYLPNLFNPRAAHTYTQSVLEKMAGRFEKFIPGVFNGFVSEMPTAIPADGGVPWDDDLVIKYRSRYKKEILDALPALFVSADDIFAKNRAHIYNFIAQSLYERFPAVIESWAAKLKMSQWVLTPERDIADSPNQLTDLFAVPQGQIAVAGIQSQTGIEDCYPTLKAVADMNALEHRRETVAVIGRNRSGQSASLQTLKNEIDICASLGIQHLLLDGCYVNLDRRSHLKSPLNHSWYHPEWPWMKELCNHAVAMLSFTIGLAHTRNVVVVMPYGSAMADYRPDSAELHRKAMSCFRKTVLELRSLNVEFDIVSEQYLLTCTVNADGTFTPANLPKHRQIKGSIVVFPYARLINNSAFVFLEKLVIKGGSIIFINEAPQGGIDDGLNPSFTARVNKIVRQKTGSAHVVMQGELAQAFCDVPRPVQATVAGKPCADIMIQSSKSAQGYDVYMLHNLSDRKDYSAIVELPEIKHIYYADLSTDSIHEHTSVEHIDDIVCVEIDFSPRQTTLLLASDTRLGATAVSRLDGFQIAGLPRQYRLVVKDRWPFVPESPNVMPLAAWNTKMGLLKDHAGFFHFHETAFDVDQRPESCVLSLDSAFCNNPDTIEVMVNGVTTKPISNTLADRFGDSAKIYADTRLNYDVMDSLTGGTNRISIRTTGTVFPPSPIDFPPILLGAFSLRKGPRGWMIDLPQGEVAYGSWTTGGYPYLCGYGQYQQVVELPSEYQKLILRFSGISGATKLKINDKEIGTCVLQPACFDVTGLVEPKRNTFSVTIASNSDNVFRMNGRPAGLTGDVFLDIY